MIFKVKQLVESLGMNEQIKTTKEFAKVKVEILFNMKKNLPLLETNYSNKAVLFSV